MARSKGRRLTTPLPFKLVSIGELTADPKQPHNDVVKLPDNVRLEIFENPIRNIQQVQVTQSGVDLGAQLFGFLETRAQAMHLGQVQIQVEAGTQYLLRNSSIAFREACADQKVRSWIENFVLDEGRSAAMIVGMYSYRNATYKLLHRNQGGVHAGGSDPTGTTNVGAWAGGRGGAADFQAFNVPGEQIFAVEYRRLKSSHFSKKSVDKMKLAKGPNLWEVFLGDRSKGTASGEQEENIVEFVLGDDGDNPDKATEGDDDDESSDDEEVFEGSYLHEGETTESS